MLKNHKGSIRKVSKINIAQEQRISDFLQGCVYSWCKNRKNEWFALRDLMGGDNFFWKGTPLLVLFEKHFKINREYDKSIKKAANDAGWLLKKVIVKDKREFGSKSENLTKKYKWTGKE